MQKTRTNFSGNPLVKIRPEKTDITVKWKNAKILSATTSPPWNESKIGHIANFFYRGYILLSTVPIRTAQIRVMGKTRCFETAIKTVIFHEICTFCSPKTFDWWSTQFFQLLSKLDFFSHERAKFSDRWAFLTKLSYPRPCSAARARQLSPFFASFEAIGEWHLPVNYFVELKRAEEGG